MKTALAALAAISMTAVAVVPAAQAKGRTSYLTFPIADVLNDPANAEHLEGFTFTFGGGKGTRIKTTSSRRTDARPFKSDAARCQRALLNALVAVRRDAEASGGTAVVNLYTTSTETGAPLKSSTEYACIAGGSNARVYLSGDVVK